jgi:hypothetical protein
MVDLLMVKISSQKVCQRHTKIRDFANPQQTKLIKAWHFDGNCIGDSVATL